MSIWEDILFPLASLGDPENMHNLGLRMLKTCGNISSLAWALREEMLVDNPRLAQTIAGIPFKNPIGLAAGFDKNANAVLGLEALGFGFIELGTVTRYAQPGNPPPRLFRLKRDKALINRMGFNNDGVDAVVARLAAKKQAECPVGISLGKSKVTPIEKAAEDYAYSLEKAYPHGDYFAVNVSSPNTPGLRSLQDKDALNGILGALNVVREKLLAAGQMSKPIFVKIAPDLTEEAILEVLDVIAENGVAGIIATNTTISRDGLLTVPHEEGGLSGKPLTLRSRKIVSFIRDHAPELPIIGVGGIFNGDDAYEMLAAGANLVQIYTGFVYGGPAIVRNMNDHLLAHMTAQGVAVVSKIPRNYAI